MTTPANTRRKRHVRDPKFSRTVVPTERDTSILKDVHRYRLLNSRHIVALLGAPNPKKIIQRLQLLYQAGYLDRLVQRAGTTFQPGSVPEVYALDTLGGQHLGLRGHRVDWRAKNRALKPLTYHHTLLIADIMVAFEAACRESGTARFIPFEEILETTSPQSTRKHERPGTWKVRAGIKDAIVAKNGLEAGITPDKIFGLHFTDSPAGRNRSYFLLEADRGTMPVSRKGLVKSSILKKLILYHATRRQSLQEKLLGIHNFRVLTVTSLGADRARSMVQACKQLRDHSHNFLFTDLETFMKNNPLEMEWAGGDGKRAVIYKSRTVTSSG